MSRFLLGVTGASGSIYAVRTLFHLKRLGHKVSLVETSAGKSVAAFEGFSDALSKADFILDCNDFFAEAASGNSDFSGMAIVPCSMGTLGKIAGGIADNLLSRAADVCLKEHRPLVVVPREMPYNLIHLENMTRLLRAGATIVSASPHFYTNPQTIENLVDTVAAKILTHLGVPNEIVPKWGSHR